MHVTHTCMVKRPYTHEPDKLRVRSESTSWMDLLIHGCRKAGALYYRPEMEPQAMDQLPKGQDMRSVSSNWMKTWLDQDSYQRRNI